MDPSRRILSWLDHVEPLAEEPERRRPHKRARLDPLDLCATQQESLPTPDPSEPPSHHPPPNMAPPRGKRDRTDTDSTPASDDGDDSVVIGGDSLDIEATPRPSHNLQPVLLSSGGQSRESPSKKSVTDSSTSRASSPKKQMRIAQLDETGFTHHTFSTSLASLPTSLTKLHSELKKISNLSKMVLPGWLKDSGLDFPPSAINNTNSPSDIYFPPLDAVAALVARAAECDQDNEGESSWNMDVHREVLSWVFRRKIARLVDFRYCTGAQILSEFRPKLTPSKMIDFALYIHPPQSDQVDEITARCRLRPGLSINHTDWGNLVQHPIALSIETKGPTEDALKATLQMGTWQAAQWRSLWWGRGGKPLGGLEFLPGIIITAHKWDFVASTWVKNKDSEWGGKSALYTSLPLGRTDSPEDVYKLVAALAHLKGWIEDVYWPAFRGSILTYE